MAHGLYWNMGPTICPSVSITSKVFTRFQIVLPNLKLEIQCAFIHSPINCICNIDFQWGMFPVTIFYSLSPMLLKEWECLASPFNVQCLFHPAFLLLVQSLSMCFKPLFLWWIVSQMQVVMCTFSLQRRSCDRTVTACAQCKHAQFSVDWVPAPAASHVGTGTRRHFVCNVYISGILLPLRWPRSFINKFLHY